MTFNVHAGHNPSGKIACGAIGFLNESNQVRKIKDEIIKLLKANSHTVYDCTCEDGTNQSNVLSKIVAKCNAHTVDLDISIHLNAGRNDKKGDGKNGGVEVLLTKNADLKGKVAKSICEEVAKLGYTNRGIKVNNGLYFLNKANSPALLVECCFVDDKDDYELYQKGNYKAMANAIADGILKSLPTIKTTTTPSSASVATASTASTAKEYKVKITTDSLNVRVGASATDKIVASLKKGEVYTIVEEKNNWGKLKSGTGWISLSTSYVQKV